MILTSKDVELLRKAYVVKVRDLPPSRPPLVDVDAEGTARLAEIAAIIEAGLYMQPPTFTWDDVDELRDSAQFIEATIQSKPGAKELHSIADRIAALLPPRES